MTLIHTLEEVRELETEYVGTKGRPYKLWPGGLDTNDCVGYQTERLGLRTGHETLAQLEDHLHWISIAAFRAHYQWPEVSASSIESGDLVISNWTGTKVDGRLEAEHMEYDYSADHSAGSIVIIGANTGPAPGVPTPNGIWKKTRPLDTHILFGIRPPYKSSKPSISRKHLVKVVAIYVNAKVPTGLPRTTAAGPGKDTGLEGKNYWKLVQTWGRAHGYYGSHYVIDGIPGPQSRIVEAAAYKAATAKK